MTYVSRLCLSVRRYTGAFLCAFFILPVCSTAIAADTLRGLHASYAIDLPGNPINSRLLSNDFTDMPDQQVSLGFQDHPIWIKVQIEPDQVQDDLAFLVITPPSLPVKTMPELIALAKAKPGTLNCAHSGPGTTAHLGCEMLKSVAKIDIVSIPYKGTVPAIIDVVAGQAQLMFAVMQGGLPQVKAGKLKAVAITGKKRHPSIPDVQTISEAGYAGADFVTWNGIHIPVKTPKPIVAKLNAEFDRILKLPDVKERMFELGLDGVGGSAESFGVFVQEDIARWAKVIKEANVKAEQ